MGLKLLQNKKGGATMADAESRGTAFCGGSWWFFIIIFILILFPLIIII
jgi:hypothetical protein